MKRLFFTLIMSCLLLGACHTKDIGYLMATTASYPSNTVNITHLDGVTEENNPELYAQYKNKITNKSPWTTSEIEGVLGTSPILYSISKVKVVGDGGDAALFQQELKIMGGGRMQVPFDFKAPKGIYSVSILVANEGYSRHLDDIFVFVVE